MEWQAPLFKILFFLYKADILASQKHLHTISPICLIDGF